jgi:ABC-type amino acid transport substrate-binding protein
MASPGGISKFSTSEDDLKALRGHSLDAFVYDKPILAWIVRQRFSSSIELLDTTFEAQKYAFALPTNHPLIKSINITLLDAIQNDWWEETTFRYLGSK